MNRYEIPHWTAEDEASFKQLCEETLWRDGFLEWVEETLGCQIHMPDGVFFKASLDLRNANRKSKSPASPNSSILQQRSTSNAAETSINPASIDYASQDPDDIAGGSTITSLNFRSSALFPASSLGSTWPSPDVRRSSISTVLSAPSFSDSHRETPMLNSPGTDASSFAWAQMESETIPSASQKGTDSTPETISTYRRVYGNTVLRDGTSAVIGDRHVLHYYHSFNGDNDADRKSGNRIGVGTAFLLGLPLLYGLLK